MKATAKAHTNIALIKYWGKRNEALILPTNSSLSITLDKFYTTTTVEFNKEQATDEFYLDGQQVNEKEQKKITKFLDVIRKLAGKQEYAIIHSINNVPTAAGFASSASGLAALAAAATKAIGLAVDRRMLSQIARRGSGSACRSIYGGYVEWQKGEKSDGTDSYAVPILDAKEWDLTVLSVMLESKPKKVLSREGMKRTVDTSVFYDGWLQSVDNDLSIVKQALAVKDFEMLGTVVEKNALKMHATTLGADPPFLYWQSGTLEVMEEVASLRSNGIQAYFTIDAGPNVKVLCEPKDEQQVIAALNSLVAVREIFVCHPGPGVTYVPTSS
ncbi:diphosphomevalonate decarboxylase [Caldibacillus lycopersici]|uniref:diphosphomevalonate decarboxylase n=1 Tax=Perspicuibacillus lycopersici TaxID=1325689 RepID=A0AAE3IWU3_9BACI|nr:diphosphomevalonate decarboxylase [Perspicuibacillus lycopersici]MCU9615048.1 diphosphomevalonate decarboxylase [Perspicuibacillus lycopersici]